MFGIDQTRAALLNNELKLNQEITKEKLHQNNLSSESMKLYQISQKYGIQAATAISGFVSGKTPLAAFETGGKFSDLMTILHDFFASELEQRQAQEFFFKGHVHFIFLPLIKHQTILFVFVPKAS